MTDDRKIQNMQGVPIMNMSPYKSSACLALTGALVSLAAGSPAGRPPNIVFIMTDDLGISDLGIYGSDYHLTPRLDRLAMEGMRFTQAYAAASVCSPTRASVLTGRYPHRVQMTDSLPWDRLPVNPRLIPPNHLKELPASQATYAQALRAAGYRTALIGKWHLGNEHTFFEKKGHEAYGFDEAFDANIREINKVDKGVEILSAEALAFIERYRDRPFLLALHHHTPHVPLATPPEYESLYNGVPAGARHKNKKYAGMMSHLDDSVGRLLDKLDELDLAGNTVVVFTSDNGGFTRHTSNGPFRDGKSSLYEGGLRVPLMVRWPGVVEVGSVCETPVHSADFFPTLLEMAGLPLMEEAHVDGVSLLPLLRGDGDISSRHLFWYMPHYRPLPVAAVLSGDWKLLHTIDPGTYELYNVRVDPGEQNDLAAAHPSRTEELSKLLERHLVESGAQRMRPNPMWKEDQPQGPLRNFGVFYPKPGGTYIQINDQPYPEWFNLAEQPREHN